MVKPELFLTSFNGVWLLNSKVLIHITLNNYPVLDDPFPLYNNFR